MEKGKKTKGLAKLKGEHEAVVMAACGVVSLCYGDMSLSSASGVAMSFGKISDVVRGKKSEHGLENPKEIDKIRDAVLEAYNAKFDLERDIELQLYVEAADTALAEHLVSCSLSRKEIVDAMTTVRIDDETQEARADFSQVATDLIMERLAIAAPQHFDKAKAKSEPYHYARNVVQIGVNAALTQVDYFKQIEPQAIARLLGGLAEVAHEQKEQGKVLGEIAGGVEIGFESNNERLDRIEAMLGAQMVEKGLASKDTPHEQLFAELAKQFDSPLNELMGVIGGVLTNIKNPDNFGQLLQMSLTALKVSREEYHRLSSLGNEIAAEGFEVEGIDELLKQADTALNDPDIVDLTTARAKLREARKRYDTSVQKRYQQQQENTARMLVAEAKLAQASSDVDEAAELYDEAMEKVAHDNDLMRDYLWAKGVMLYHAGIVSPEPEFLQSSIKTWQQLLNICDRKTNPDFWANAKNCLGAALHALGCRSSDGALLHEAVDAYRAALKEWKQQTDPQNWAMIQNNLGSALQELGSRSTDDALLHQAVEAYRAALHELTREGVPLKWAAVQNGLGFALQKLGCRSTDDSSLHQAVEACRAALQEMTRDRVPLDWAATQDNLGAALQTLGFRSADDALLHEAVEAYRAALQVRTRDRVPLKWAGTQNNLGITLQTLGSRSTDDALLHQAVVAFRAALQERTRDRVPFNWAVTQNNLGGVLQELGSRSSDDALLHESVEAYRAALQEWTRDHVPLDWAGTQHNLGSVLAELGVMQSDQYLVQEAIKVFELSLEERRKDNAPYYHHQTKRNLEIAKQVLADLEAGESSGGE